MFVRVSDNILVNTDHIVAIDTNKMIVRTDTGFVMDIQPDRKLRLLNQIGVINNREVYGYGNKVHFKYSPQDERRSSEVRG